MNFRKILKYTWFPILLMAVFAWFFSPVTFLKGVDAAEVAYVEIFDGNTGDESRVTSQEVISHVLGNLAENPARRSGISVLEMGYRFRLTFVGTDGSELGQVTINNESTIRGSVFFYTSENATLCFDYLWDLMDKEHGYI